MDPERICTSGACQEHYRGEEGWSDSQGTPQHRFCRGAEGSTNRIKSRRSELRRSGSPKALPRHRGGQARQEEKEAGSQKKKLLVQGAQRRTATPSSAKKLCSDVWAKVIRMHLIL